MSWEQLRAIRDAAIQEATEHAQRAPTRCPNDGTILRQDPEGQLHCGFDGWVWDGVTFVD